MMKKLNLIRYMSLVAVVCLLTYCSTNEASDDMNQENLSIRLSTAGIYTAPTTRSDASDTYNNSLPANSQIGVYIYDSDETDISINHPGSPSGRENLSNTWVYKTIGAVDSETGKSDLQLISHTKNPRYPTISPTNNNYKPWVELVAIFPNNPNVTPSSPTSYTFSVALDQRSSDNIIASDLLTSDLMHLTAEDCEGKVLNLVLKHRMAKIQVSFTPKSGSDLTTANMPVDFDVLNIYRTVTITQRTGVITAGNADKATESSPLLGSTTQSFFIPPQSVGAGETLLKFNIIANASNHFNGINGATFTVPTGGVTFEAGKVYKINVIVDVDFATMTGTITPWADGGELEYPLYTDSIL